ncbi:MAG: isocitrate/isopropylmalate dehydrogenase family protein [bacterium]
MAKYKIAWLPGDGVGAEVLEAARIVLDTLPFDAEYMHGDIGWEFWKSEGDALPQRTMELLKSADAAMFGAITSKPAKAAADELAPALRDKGLTYRSPIVRMRQLFDLYVCFRPCKAYPGNPLNFKEGIDLVIFRENTEDLYSGVEFAEFPDHLRTLPEFAKVPQGAAVSLKINTRKGCERIIRAAFDFARKEGRKKVTCVHKANVVRASDGLFLSTFKDAAAEYKDISSDEANIDALCMWLLKNPFNYDVLVAPNLYGDIISDLCAQMVGGLGFASSGNIGEKVAVFEPTHGSAPKYAGMYKVNPLATILAARLMLDWLGCKEDAARIDDAVAKVIAKGECRTYDMGGSAKTLEMANAVAAEL